MGCCIENNEEFKIGKVQAKNSTSLYKRTLFLVANYLTASILLKLKKLRAVTFAINNITLLQ